MRACGTATSSLPGQADGRALLPDWNDWRIYPEDIDELLDAVRDVMKQPAAAFDRETAPPVPAVRVAHV
jgi:hypothetical protein